MDEMLKEMCANGAGVLIAGLYLGSAAHADDIRSLSETTSATESQAASLINFTHNIGLKINASNMPVTATLIGSLTQDAVQDSEEGLGPPQKHLAGRVGGILICWVIKLSLAQRQARREGEREFWGWGRGYSLLCRYMYKLHTRTLPYLYTNRGCCSQEPTRSMTLRSLLQATKWVQSRKQNVLDIGGNPILEQISP